MSAPCAPEREKGDNAALVYLLTGDEKFAAKAISRTRKGGRSAFIDNKLGPILTYDWLIAGYSALEKERLPALRA